MSFGSRVWKIFRNIPDIGIQAADFFVDGISALGDDEFGVVEGFIESWEDNVLGKPSGTGTAERSLIGATMGPEGIIGATVGAIPEDVRKELGADQWNLMLSGLDFTWTYGIARPVATLATIANLNQLSFEQSKYLQAIRSGEVDPRVASMNGWLPFNHRTFDPTTWREAWNLTQHRSPGQAMTLALNGVNIYNPEELKEFKETNMYYITSGVLDVGLAVAADPTYLGAKAARLKVLNRRARNLHDASGGSITSVGPYLEHGVVRPGLFGERPYMEPFIQTQRPAAQRESIILRTPSRRDIRIGGEKLHNWILEHEAPALTRLLGGSVTEMLTIPGGRKVGSPGRVRDELFFENYSYKPKWMDDQPSTMDETLTSYVGEAERIKTIFDDELESALNKGDIPLHVIGTGEASLDPRWGTTPASFIWELNPDSIGASPWRTLEDNTRTMIEDFQAEFDNFAEGLSSGKYWDARSFGDEQGLFDGPTLDRLPEKIDEIFEGYGPLEEAFQETVRRTADVTMTPTTGLFAVLRSLDQFIEDTLGAYTDSFNIDPTSSLGRVLPEQYHELADDLYSLRGRFIALLADNPLPARAREALKRAEDEGRGFASWTGVADSPESGQLVRNTGFTMALENLIDAHRLTTRTNLTEELNRVIERSLNEIDGSENYAINNLWNALHPGRGSVGPRKLRELIQRLDEQFPGMGWDDFLDNDYLRDVLRRQAGGNEDARRPFDSSEFGDDWSVNEGRQEQWAIYVDQATTVIEDLLDRQRNTAPLRDADSPNPYADLEQRIEQVRQVIEDIIVEGAIERRLDAPENRVSLWGPAEFEAMQSGFNYLVAATDEMIDDYVRAAIPNNLLEAQEAYREVLGEQSSLMGMAGEMSPDDWNRYVDDMYGKNRWAGARGSYTTEKFLDRLTLRLFKELPTWGPFYKVLPKDQLWQRAQIYARLANGGPVDGSSWLPYYNLIRLEKGNPAVKAAMTAQAKDFSYIWSLLRDIEAPVIRNISGDEVRSLYDAEQPVEPRGIRDTGGDLLEIDPRRRPDDPDTIDFSYRRDFEETLKLSDEGIDKVVDRTREPGDEMQYGVPNSMKIRHNQERVTVHWHFREIRHARQNILALEEAIRKRKFDEKVRREDKNYGEDEVSILDEATEIMDTNVSFEALSKANAERLRLTLKAKEAAHALYIKNYLFSPRALAQMAEVQGKRLIEDLMNEVWETMRIPEAQPDAPAWAWSQLGLDVSEEALRQAGDIIDMYEHVRFDHALGREMGFTDFEDLFPVVPPARGFVRESANDLIDFAGFDPNSPYMELIDRISEMDKFPWQAVLGLDDALVGMLVKTYERIPPLGFKEDIATNVMQTRTAPFDDPVPEMLSSTEAHSLVADQIIEAAMAPLNPALAKALPSAPSTKTGVLAKTLFSKSGPLAGPMNSRFVRLFSEKIPHGVINVHDRSTVASQLDVMFRELGRINLLVPPGMGRRERKATLKNAPPETPRRLASGEDFTLLDLAIMTYKGTPEAPWPVPRDRVEAAQRVDDLMIEFLDSYGDELAIKIDRLNEAALNGAINAVTPHPIFKDIDWGSAGVSAAMKGILRGDIDAAKRLLEDAAEHTERRYGNSDFTEVVIPELGGTTFIYKPMSPSQMRQTLVMPRWDKFQRLFQVLQGDIKTIIGPNGENLDVSVSARNAIVRATRREALTMWKRHTLLTPRWQMVVNTDSQLRNIAHLGAAMALGRLGGSFDELRVRWLRKAGVDINAVVADKLVEQLPDGYMGAGWVKQVEFYKRSHDEGVVGFERTIEEFVADAIGEEYANKRANIRTLAMTGSGWFFGGPVGAAAAAGLYTAYSRDSLAKLARRQLADTYGVALRAEALDLVERANRLDISEFMRAQYPDLPQYALDEVAEIKAEHWLVRDEAWNSWINEAGTTESWMYRRLLEDEGLINAGDIAARINWQLIQELGAKARGDTPFGRYFIDPMVTPASDKAMRNMRAFRARRDGVDRSGVPLRGDRVSWDDIANTEVYSRSSYLTQLIIEHRFNKLQAVNVDGLDLIVWPPMQGSLMPDIQFFIQAEDVTQILDTQGSLKNLAEQLQTTIKDRNEVARLLATRAEIVNDYQTKIVGDAKLDPSMGKPISMLEEAAEILNEWGYGSTQVGSTRVDKAFGNTPQQQEIWRRGISANPMARAQLDAEADVQRRFEKFQGAHQYDILNQYEEANFSKAYDDFLIRHVIPQDLDKTNLAQQLWAKVFSETERVGGYDPNEIVKWMRTNNVEELLPEAWHGFDRGVGDGLYELAVKMGYEANSILPSSIDVFDEARRSLIQGNPISWNVEVAAGIRKLNQRHEDFWALYKQLAQQYRQATSSVYTPQEFFEDLYQRRFEGPRWIGDTDNVRQLRPFNETDAGRQWQRVIDWDSIRQDIRGPGTLEIFEHSWVDVVEKSLGNESTNVLIARTLSTDIIEQMRRTAVSEERGPKFRHLAGTAVRSDLRGQFSWASNGIGDFGKVVTDSSFIDAMQSKNIIDRYKGLLDGIFENLTMVEDYLSRGTLYESIYTREIFENLQLYRLDDIEGVNYRISPEALKGVVNRTRASALQQTKDVLYDLANRSKFEELVGEISPFFGAWQEVTTRWFGIAAENPVFVFRMLKLWTVATAEDENGQSIMMVQLPNVFDYEIDAKFFGSHKLFGSLSVASKMPVDLNLRSASLIGGFAGTGPIVSFAASELSIQNPDIYESLDFLFPYGLVEGGNVLERYAAAHTPSWIKSAASVAGLDTDRKAATAARVLQDILAEQYIQGNLLPNTEAGAKRLLDEVERRTKMIYSMRMLRSLAIPVSYQQQSPYWPILSEFWRTEKEYGAEVADLWLMENHPELWAATARRTLADGVIAGSLEGHRYYEDHKAMATEYPELGAFITGEVGAIDVQFAYNKAIAQIERQEGRRDTLSPEDFLHEAGSNKGWREYRVFRNSLTNELNKRMQAGGSGSLNAQSNFDLWTQRRNFVTELSRKNPMWASEFNKIGDPITQKKILEGFRLIVEDEAFAYRPEIPLIQRYLQLHDGIAQSLLARAEATGNRSYLRLSYTRNQDLSRQWEIGLLQLLTFPDFGNVYDRYFSNIESVNTSNLSQFAPATLRTGN